MSTPGIDASPAPLPEQLLQQRLVATLPDRAMPSLVAAVEVMVQEGISVVSLPAGKVEQAARLRSVFGPRATLGVHDLSTDQELDEALAAGVDFLALAGPDEALAARIREAAIPFLISALTPTEVQAVWRTGVSAVLVVPAEVMGSGYPEVLVQLTPGIDLCARGGLGAYSARRWAEAGATAVWLDEALLGDAFSGGSLGSLRERCQTFRTAVDEG